MTDTAHLNIRVTNTGSAIVTTELGRLTVTAGNAEVRVNSLSRAMQQNSRTSQQLAGVTNRLDMALGSLVSVAMVKRIMDYSDAWTSLTNKLIVVKRANEDLAQVQNAVFEVAQRTRSDLATTAQLYSRLAQAMSHTGASSSEVLRLTESLNKALIVSGATASESSAALLQFSQAMASGVLRGDEFRSVAEQAPKITQILAKALNTNIGGLRELAYSGRLTADVVLEAMSQAAQGIDEEFSKTLPTLSQNFAIVQNNITKFVGESQTARTGVMGLSSGLVTLSQNLDTVVNVAAGFLAVMGVKAVTALGAKTAATLASAAADARQAVVTKQVQAIMASSLGITAQATAAKRAQTATELQLARAQMQAAKGTQMAAVMQQQYNVALTANRVATVAAIQAQQALQVQLNTVTGSAGRAAAAMGVLRGVMGMLGGPVGVIMLGVGALWSWSEASAAAKAETQQYADGIADLTDKLDTMTDAQVKATAAEAQRQIPKMKEQMEDLSKSVEYHNKQAEIYQRIVDKGNVSDSERQEMLKKITYHQQESAIKTAELEKASVNLANAQGLVANSLTTSINRLVNYALAANDAKNAGKGVTLGFDAAALKTSADGVTKITAKVTEQQMVMKGTAAEAHAYSRIVTQMGDHYGKQKPVIDGLVFGTMSLADATKQTSKEFVDNILAMKSASIEEYNLTNQVKTHKSETVAAAKEQRRITGLLEDYANKMEEARIETVESARERAALTAVHKLGANATAEEVAQIRKAAEAYYDYTEQIKKSKEIVNQRDKAKKVVSDGTGETNFEKINTEERTKLDLMESYRLQDLENSKVYEDAKTAISKQASMERENLQKVLFNRMLTFSQDSMGIILDGLKQGTSEQNFLYKAMFAAQQAMQIPSILANTETAASAALAWGTQQGGPAMGLTMAGIVRALGYTSAATVGGLAIAGMAHDGIDKIPREGTWLLQQGERVINKPSNDKLTRFLDNSSNSNSNQQTIYQTFQIGSNVDQDMIGLIKKAAEDGAKGGYNMVVQDFATNGAARKLLTRG